MEVLFKMITKYIIELNERSLQLHLKHLPVMFKDLLEPPEAPVAGNLPQCHSPPVDGNPIHSIGIPSLKTLTQNCSQIHYLNTTVFTFTGVLATLVSRNCQYFGMSSVRFVVVTVVTV